MSKTISFVFSIVCYVIGVGSIVCWIGFTTSVIPEIISINSEVTMPFLLALTKNVGLIVLFGLIHSLMSRKTTTNAMEKLTVHPLIQSHSC